MSKNRLEKIYTAFEKSYAIMDTNVHNDFTKKYKFRKQVILTDKSLTENEKSEAIKMLSEDYNFDKIRNNKGTRRICENCEQECLATTYCEICIRNFLIDKFSSWTSGNDNIDNLIQACQKKSIAPNRIVEWIPYDKLEDIKYFTKGGCSEIFTATWIGGYYCEWDSDQKQLKRAGSHQVILKKLENVEDANRSWVEEAVSHLTISNKWAEIVLCNGLTQDPGNGKYMIVMEQMDTDLRSYLRQYHNELTWERRIKITFDIVEALYFIHEEKAVHRDLHTGNILYFHGYKSWYISDLGFCGPADKPLGAIYGNLPYIAPEVIFRGKYTFASDIYSIGIIMWEISSGYPPFYNHEHNYHHAMNISNGIRPKVVAGTPVEYEELMQQCWNTDPSKRPKINTLLDKIEKMWKKSYNNIDINESNTLKINIELDDSSQNSQSYNSNLNLYPTSRVYYLEDLLRLNGDELEGFHSKPYSFNIPDNNGF